MTRSHGAIEEGFQVLGQVSAGLVERCDVRLVELNQKIDVAGFGVEVSDGCGAEHI